MCHYFSTVPFIAPFWHQMDLLSTYNKHSNNSSASALPIYLTASVQFTIPLHYHCFHLLFKPWLSSCCWLWCASSDARCPMPDVWCLMPDRLPGYSSVLLVCVRWKYCIFNLWSLSAGVVHCRRHFRHLFMSLDEQSNVDCCVDLIKLLGEKESNNWWYILYINCVYKQIFVCLLGCTYGRIYI